MIKNKTQHIARRNRLTSKRLGIAVEQNPNAFRGLKIPACEVVYKEHYTVRNISIAGLLLAFFVRTFH